jgi:hypothetical protein
MVYFAALNLLIQESYGAKREDMFEVAKHPDLTLTAEPVSSDAAGLARATKTPKKLLL